MSLSRREPTTSKETKIGKLGIIALEEGQQLFIEVDDDLSEEDLRRLAGTRAATASDRPADLPPGAEPTGVKEDMRDALAQLRGNIRILANEVHQALQDHKPSEWSLEFSIGFKGKANPVPFILQGEANSALKVTATWKE
jgi:hypothetical protein